MLSPKSKMQNEDDRRTPRRFNRRSSHKRSSSYCAEELAEIQAILSPGAKRNIESIEIESAEQHSNPDSSPSTIPLNIFDVPKKHHPILNLDPVINPISVIEPIEIKFTTAGIENVIEAFAQRKPQRPIIGPKISLDPSVPSKRFINSILLPRWRFPHNHQRANRAHDIVSNIHQTALAP